MVPPTIKKPRWTKLHAAYSLLLLITTHFFRNPLYQRVPAFAFPRWFPIIPSVRAFTLLAFMIGICGFQKTLSLFLIYYTVVSVSREFFSLPRFSLLKCTVLNSQGWEMNRPFGNPARIFLKGLSSTLGRTPFRNFNRSPGICDFEVTLPSPFGNQRTLHFPEGNLFISLVTMPVNV